MLNTTISEITKNEKIKVTGLSLFITLSIGVATHASADQNSSLIKINPLTSNSSVVMNQTTSVQEINPDSKKGKLIGAFKILYKDSLERAKISGNTQQNFLPKETTGFSRTKKSAFGQNQEGNSTPLLNSKVESRKSDLSMKLSSSGTPTFVKGIQKEGLSPYSKIRFNPDDETIKTNNLAFLEKYNQLLKLESPSTELKVSKLFQDGLGQFHTRYSQSYNGIPVWGAQLITHSNQLGDVLSMDGKYIPSPSHISTTPDISLDDATIIAISSLLPNADSRTTESTGRLVIYSDKKNLTPVLAWEIKLDASLTEQYVVMVNAKMSDIIFSYNNIHTDNVSGKGADEIGQTKNINVWQNGNKYYLYNSTKNMYESGLDPLATLQKKGFISVVDAKNEPSDNKIEQVPDLYHITSESPTSGWLTEGAGAAYNLSETYDYFKETHNRNSLDGEGGSIIAIVRIGNNFDNAFWHSDTKLMFFGNGDNYASSLDVVAHELAHGVTSTESNLVYQGQSGAINEALSDIFGEAIENYSTGSNDWLMGTELRNAFRNLKDPGSITSALGRPYPSKMSEYENLALTPESDNGGVHINSSIINRAFYLLAEGQSDSVGLDTAAKIFYRANTSHLLLRSDFSDLRTACLQSAEEIYGANSSQVSAVASAFDTVEIYDSPTQPTPNTGTAPNSEDSVIMMSIENGEIHTKRYEKTQGDPAQGSNISSTTAYGQRPAVSGDGEIAAFITTNNDLCLVGIVSGEESCLNSPGTYHAVAFSPDSRYISLILIDSSTKTVSNSVVIIDMSTDPSTSVEYELLAAPVNGTLNNQISYADAMDFNSNNRYLVYDALNVISFSDGSPSIEVWSIYALDLTAGSTIALVPPQSDADVGNPSLSNINPNLMTFDIFSSDGMNSVVIADASSGEITNITETSNFSVPSLTGDDKSVVYSVEDTTNSTGYSLHTKPISGGPASLWIHNAYAGVVYRRAESTPEPEPTDSGSSSGGSLSFVTILLLSLLQLSSIYRRKRKLIFR